MTEALVKRNWHEEPMTIGEFVRSRPTSEREWLERRYGALWKVNNVPAMDFLRTASDKATANGEKEASLLLSAWALWVWTEDILNGLYQERREISEIVRDALVRAGIYTPPGN